jgi:hypothetical protein
MGVSSLDLHEAAGREPRPHLPDERGAGGEDLAGSGIRRKVHVALPVPQLDVLQAVPLLRPGAQGLGQELEALDAYGQLPPAGGHDLAPGPHPVADVELGEGLEAIAEEVSLGEQLDAAASVLEVRERHLAVAAHGHHTPCDARFVAGVRAGLQALVPGRDPRGGVGAVEREAVRRLAPRLERVQLGEPRRSGLVGDVLGRLRRRAGVSGKHCARK